MTRKLLKTVAIVVIALAPLVAAGSAEAHGGGFHRRVSRPRVRSRRLWGPGAPRRQISVWWVFRRFLSRLLWQLLPWPLRIRPLLSDRVRDDLLLLSTAQTPRAN